MASASNHRVLGQHLSRHQAHTGVSEGELSRIVPGISISSTGEVSVDAEMASVLIDLAIRLDERSRHPVDVEHVLAAIIIAARHGELDRGKALMAEDGEVLRLLDRHVAQVLDQYGPDLDPDDP